MKILTTILTCSSTQERADACLATWIKDIKSPHEYYLYGDEKQSQKMDKVWNCEPDDGEERFRLPEKTYKMLVKSLDYEWDFLFKCDDDTYLNFDKLVEFLKDYDANDDLYLGTRIVNSFAYAQGGAGFILTRSAVIKCLKSLKHFYKDIDLSNRMKSKTLHAEDYSVGLALRDHKIDLIHTGSLSTPNPNIARKDQSVCINAIIKENKITTHYVMPETMITIYNHNE